MPKKKKRKKGGKEVKPQPTAQRAPSGRHTPSGRRVPFAYRPFGHTLLAYGLPAATIPTWLLLRLPKTKQKIEQDLIKAETERADWLLKDNLSYIARLNELEQSTKKVSDLLEKFNIGELFENKALVERYAPKNAFAVLGEVQEKMKEINRLASESGLPKNAIRYVYRKKSGLSVEIADERMPERTKKEIQRILRENKLLFGPKLGLVANQTTINIRRALIEQVKKHEQAIGSTKQYLIDSTQNLKEARQAIKWKHYFNLAKEAGGLGLGSIMAVNLVWYLVLRSKYKRLTRKAQAAREKELAEIRAKVDARKKARLERLGKYLKGVAKGAKAKKEKMEKQAKALAKPRKRVVAVDEIKRSEQARRRAVAAVYQEALSRGFNAEQITALAKEIYPVINAETRKQKLDDFSSALVVADELNVSLKEKAEYLKAVLRRGFEKVALPKEKMAKGQPKKIEVFSVRHADRFIQRLDSAKYVPVRWIKSLQANVNEFHRLPEAQAVKATQHLILYMLAQGGMSERTTYGAVKHRSGCDPVGKLFDTAFQDLLKNGLIVENRKGRSFYRISSRHRGLIQKYSIKATRR